jgi:hypothetical protein
MNWTVVSWLESFDGMETVFEIMDGGIENSYIFIIPSYIGIKGSLSLTSLHCPIVISLKLYTYTHSAIKCVSRERGKRSIINLQSVSLMRKLGFLKTIKLHASKSSL